MCAMLGLTLLDEARELPGKMALWATMAQADKLVLLHDRVLSAASDDGERSVEPKNCYLLSFWPCHIFVNNMRKKYDFVVYFSVLTQVVLLCRTVLEHYESVAGDRSSPVYRVLVLTLLSTSKPVRTVALEEVKSLLADISRAPVANNLVANLNEILEEGKVLNGKDKKDGAEDRGAEVTGKMVLDCVQALCSCRGKCKAIFFLSLRLSRIYFVRTSILRLTRRLTFLRFFFSSYGKYTIWDTER